MTKTAKTAKTANTRKKSAEGSATPDVELNGQSSANGDAHQSNSNGGAPVEAGAADGGEWIRRRAYELYLERGDAPGDELNDWLQAEREHRQQSGAPLGR